MREAGFHRTHAESDMGQPTTRDKGGVAVLTYLTTCENCSLSAGATSNYVPEPNDKLFFCVGSRCAISRHCTSAYTR